MFDAQIFFGDRPEENKMLEVKNKPYMNKPFGGFWTSTYLGEDGSDWLRWCNENEWYDADSIPTAWLVLPKYNVRVLTIDTYEDLEKMMLLYTLKTDKKFTILSSIDFEKMKRDYDAVHLTARGQAVIRLSSPLNLYGWDCESVLWLNWEIREVKKIKHDWIYPIMDYN